MSQLVASIAVTQVAPVAHFLINFGREAESVVFTYQGKTHVINRRGRSNVKGYVGNLKGRKTLTFTNGTERFSRLTEADVNVLGFVSRAGVWHELTK
jgi:hypothetical protein